MNEHEEQINHNCSTCLNRGICRCGQYCAITDLPIDCAMICDWFDYFGG